MHLSTSSLHFFVHSASSMFLVFHVFLLVPNLGLSVGDIDIVCEYRHSKDKRQHLLEALMAS